MKVALIYPRLKDRDITPPLGLLYLIGYAKKHGNFNDVKMFDNNFDDIREDVVRFAPDFIGISAMTIDYTEATRLAEYFKKRLNNIPVVIGGVHISSLPSSLAKCFDVGIVGEGERIFLDILQAFEKRGAFDPADLQNIKGLVFWDKEGKLHITETREKIDKLDEIPLIDRGLLHKEYFNRKMIPHIAKHGIEGAMLTARGCPYTCVFCSTKAFWKTMRFHSTQYVYEEVREMAKNYGVTHITIWDDLFTAHLPRIKELAEMLKSDDITKDITFSAQVRTHQMNDMLCKLFNDMNVTTAFFGFESGSDKTLGYLKNNTITVEQNRQAIVKAKEYGIRTYGSLIFGSPGETIEDMKQTIEFIRFAKKAGADALWAFIMTPFPETPMWEIAKQRGKVSDENMDWDLLSHQNVENPLMLDTAVDKEEFKKIFLQAREELNFFRVKYIKENLKNNFLDTLKTAVSNPSDTWKTISEVALKNRKLYKEPKSKTAIELAAV